MYMNSVIHNSYYLRDISVQMNVSFRVKLHYTLQDRQGNGIVHISEFALVESLHIFAEHIS